MEDKRNEIFAILNSIAPTYFQYPQILVDKVTNGEKIPDDFFPVISYFDSNHESDSYFDGKSTIDDIEYTVDVWERQNDSTGKLKEVHFDVDKALKNANYRRVSFANIYETDTKINHYSMRYKKLEEEI